MNCGWVWGHANDADTKNATNGKKRKDFIVDKEDQKLAQYNKAGGRGSRGYRCRNLELGTTPERLGNALGRTESLSLFGDQNHLITEQSGCHASDGLQKEIGGAKYGVVRPHRDNALQRDNGEVASRYPETVTFD